MYEGYGPNGVAVLIECLTDNRNRAASDVRVAMTRNGGSMADPGSVSYLFSRKGVVIVPKADGLSEDDVLVAVLDAGAEEVNDLGEAFEVVSRGHRPGAVRTALQDAGIDYESAEASFVPIRAACRSTRRAPARCSGCIDALEDSDDVQNVFANFDVSDDDHGRPRRPPPAPVTERRGAGTDVRRGGAGPGRCRAVALRTPVRTAAPRRDRLEDACACSASTPA